MTKYVSHFDFQEKIRALEVELQNVGQSKILLEKELQEVITMTSQELEESREKVLELEDEVTPALLSAAWLCFAPGSPVTVVGPHCCQYLGKINSYHLCSYYMAETTETCGGRYV